MTINSSPHIVKYSENRLEIFMSIVYMFLPLIVQHTQHSIFFSNEVNQVQLNVEKSQSQPLQ